MNKRNEQCNTPPSSRSVRSLSLGLVLVAGVAYSHLLTFMHQHSGEAEEVGWACGGGGWIDCSTNLASRYGTLFGLPISAFAAAWFFLMLAVLLTGIARNRDGRVLHRTLLYTSAPAVAATVFYALVSVFVLRSICTYCLGLYALVGMMVMLTAAGAALPWERIGRITRTAARFAIRWSIPAAAFVVALLVERRVTSDETNAAPLLAISSLESVPRLGPRDAPMKIVFFSEFECPACRMAAKEMDRFLARHPGEIEVQLVSVPISRSRDSAGSEAVPLSEYLGPALGLVMHGRGLFWDFYKGVFLSDRSVDERLLWEVASRVAGPQEIPSITRDLGKPEVRAALERNGAIAEMYKVSRIPTYIINGKVEVGALTVAALETRLAEVQERDS